MNSQDLINYWMKSSDRDYESMIKNYESKQYTWSLFIGHLCLEKLLKGIYAKVNIDNPYPPKLHNLNILAARCGIELTDEQTNILITCNSFNISARYEDYKDEFYERCTKEYTEEQIKNISKIREIFKRILTEENNNDDEND